MPGPQGHPIRAQETKGIAAKSVKESENEQFHVS